MSDIEISFDPLRIDFVAAAKLLNAFWAEEKDEGERILAFTNSLCAGAFREGVQVGFARAVTDKVNIAYVADVIVWPDFRGQGVGTHLVRAFLDHPDLTKVTAWTLYTHNAHSVYAKLGFERSGDGSYMRLER